MGLPDDTARYILTGYLKPLGPVDRSSCMAETITTAPAHPFHPSVLADNRVLSVAFGVPDPENTHRRIVAVRRRVVGQSLRRRLTRGLELDISSLRPDGVLRVAELKRATVKVIASHRTSTIPTKKVHEGVAQAQNYLKLLDENLDAILGHGVDTRRATAVLVIIGHPAFPEARINETLRVHSSHLSRITVVHL
ncbi:hypothetical protein [Streptosporangium sp. V21-05]|uniref:hypothetical protein n=1 Tax=Streptosporangium sp. V21-05 TaxID=3446115 RepID=UPI003F529F42